MSQADNIMSNIVPNLWNWTLYLPKSPYLPLSLYVGISDGNESIKSDYIIPFLNIFY